MKKQLVINVDDAKKLYPKAPTEMKEMFEKKFGKETFVPLKITDKVKTFEDVLKYSPPLTKEELAILNYKGKSKRLLNAKMDMRWDLIRDVFNQGKLNMADTSQWKHYGWFDIIKDSSKPSGLEMSVDGVCYTNTNASVGARLCFIEEDYVRHVWEYFKEDYEAKLLSQ